MTIKKTFHPLFFILCHFLFSNYQCKDEVLPTSDFEIKIALSKEQKKYALGDTIWLENQVKGRILLDRLSGNQHEILKALFEYSIAVYDKHKNDTAFDGKPRCEFLIDTLNQSIQYGTLNQGFSNDGSHVYFSYGCRDFADRYKIKIGIVLKAKGIFVLTTSYGTKGHFLPPNTDCSIKNILSKSTSLSDLHYIFDVKEGNFDVWQNTPFYPDDNRDEITTKNGVDWRKNFWFQVE